MNQSIKLSSDEMRLVREAAARSHRSIAGQAEYWMRIGRAIEQSPNFNYARIQEALAAGRSPDTLDEEEQDVYLEAFVQSLWEPTAQEEAFFAERRKKGLGVGLNENGELVSHDPQE